ncbi:MAG: cold shock domain-containing protein [Micavibrio sp.]
MNRARTQGKVKWFDARKGFGFIEPANGGNDIFVHITALQKSGIENLTEGQSVEFDIGEARGKTCAMNISRAA